MASIWYTRPVISRLISVFVRSFRCPRRFMIRCRSFRLKKPPTGRSGPVWSSQNRVVNPLLRKIIGRTPNFRSSASA